MSPHAAMSADQVAEMHALAEQLCAHSEKVEQVVQAGITDRETLVRVRALLGQLLEGAELVLVTVERQAGMPLELTELRRLTVQLRALITEELT